MTENLNKTVEGLCKRNKELEQQLTEKDKQIEVTAKSKDLVINNQLEEINMLKEKIKQLKAQLEQEKNLSQCRFDHNEQLREMIEKMRNCGNCKNYNENEGFCVLGSGYGYNCNLEKWEIKEND